MLENFRIKRLTKWIVEDYLKFGCGWNLYRTTLCSGKAIRKIHRLENLTGNKFSLGKSE